MSACLALCCSTGYAAEEYYRAVNTENWDNVTIPNPPTNETHSDTNPVAVIGVGRNDAINLSTSNWTIGNFSDNTTLTSRCNGTGPKSSIFGIAKVWADNNSINDWTIGNFGNNATLTSSSNGNSAYSSIFGTAIASEEISINNWTIGNFGNNATLTSSSIGEGARGTVFGITSFRKNCTANNWTVEFQGNANITALSFAGDGRDMIHTLGGAINENMRFYFNNLQNQGEATTVNLIGGLLASAWDDNYTSALASRQRGWFGYPANAVAIGPEMQLNIGRARTLGEEVQDNGTFETDESIASGGSASGTAGTLNVIGYMSRAVGYDTFDPTAIMERSVMRIDSGWTVNAFAPILNWDRIEILNGTLNLVANNDAGKAALSNVLAHTSMNVADSEGNLHPASVTGDDYPIEGKLYLPSKLTFGMGTDGGKIISNDSENAQIIIGESSTISVTSNGETVDPKQAIHRRVIEVSTTNSQDAFENMTNITEIKGHKGYYSFSGINLDSENTEYTEIANLQLCLSDNSADKGLVITTFDSEPEIEPSEYTKNFANAELAASVMDTNQMILTGLNAQLYNVKGNGNDPFVTVLGAHSHQDEISGFGYGNDIWGILLGEHYTWDLGRERYLRAGAVASYSKSDVDFFGSGTSNGKRAKQDMYVGGIFGSWESFNAHHLKTNANLLFGLNYSRNKTHRIDGDNIFYRGDFNSTDLFVTLDSVKNIFHLGNWQTGPYASATYNRVHQQGYTESANDMTNAVKLSSINQNLLDFILGWSIEKEWQNLQNADSRLRTYACAGWHCQPIRSHSTGTAYISGMEPFTPQFGYAERNSFFAQLGLRNKLSQHLEWYANYAADISGNYRYQNLNLGMGYTF